MKAKLFCLLLLLLFVAFSLRAIELPLPNVPQISVSITGLIRHPGLYNISPTDRLSSVLEKSMLAQELLELEEMPHEKDLRQSMSPVPFLRHDIKEDVEYEKFQSLRQVLLKRGQSEEIYDLMRYYRLGELEQNPVLKDGDIIVIGVVQHFVKIEGAVGLSGNVEYLEGDTFEDILRLSYGFLPTAMPRFRFLYRL